MIIIEYVNKLFEFLIKSRLHISFVFFIVSLEYLLSFNSKSLYNCIYISFILFLWHYSVYLFDRFMEREADIINQTAEVFEVKSKLIPFVILSLILFSIILMFFYSNNVLLSAILLFLFPWYNLRVGIFYVKKYLLLKNIYAALVIWTIPILIGIFCLSGSSPNKIILYTIFKSLTINVFLGEIFFDIKDVEGDKKHGINTLPVAIGEKYTKVIILFCLVLFHNELFTSLNLFKIIILIGLITYIYKMDSNKSTYFYHLPYFIVIFFLLYNLYYLIM